MPVRGVEKGQRWGLPDRPPVCAVRSGNQMGKSVPIAVDQCRDAYELKHFREHHQRNAVDERPESMKRAPDVINGSFGESRNVDSANDLYAEFGATINT